MPGRSAPEEIQENFWAHETLLGLLSNILIALEEDSGGKASLVAYKTIVAPEFTVSFVKMFAQNTVAVLNLTSLILFVVVLLSTVTSLSESVSSTSGGGTCCSSFNDDFNGFGEGISEVHHGGFNRVVGEIHDASSGFSGPGSSDDNHHPPDDEHHPGGGGGGGGAGANSWTPMGERRPPAAISPRLKERFVIFNNKNVTFFQAWRLCQTVGLRLASITSAEDNNELQVVIQKTRSNGLGPWWIAGTDLGEWRKWIWITTNTPVGYRTGYINFWPGEPNNGAGNERCINLGAHGGTAWDDFNCDWEFRYICENYV